VPHDATIVLRPGMQNALKDLAGFDYCWVLFWFSFSRGWKQQLVPPRDRSKRGVFATRSPDRPNPLGLSAVRIVYCDRVSVLASTPAVHRTSGCRNRVNWGDSAVDAAPS